MEKIGINVYYFAKQNELLPLHQTIDENTFWGLLPETDLVFMWNGGLGKEQDISNYCKQNGIPVYYAELGWLPQRGTYYFDSKGVNYASSLVDWVYKGKPSTDEARAKLAHYQMVYQNKSDIEVKTKDYVFVPLQVESDSQIIHYSPKIKKMQELIDYVAKFVPEKRIIFKKHPKGEPGELKIPENAEYVTEGTVHDYLPGCDYVITINSTVGVEALTYMKPVITLGQAFYGGRGITHNAWNDVEMEKAIKWAEEGRVAKGIIESFICYLFERQWSNGDFKNYKRIFGLIEDLTKAR